MNIEAEIAFFDEVLTAIHDAGARRQRITHQAQRFGAEELHIIDQLEIKRVGLGAQLQRKKILGR